MTPLELVERLSSEEYSVVASAFDGSVGTQVREAAGYRWLVNGGSSVQSMMSVDSPATLLLPNHVAMFFSLLLIDEVDSIASLGMGGGSFERFLLKQYPRSSISSVEPNEDIIKFAEEFFDLPTQVNIVASSAEDFLQTTVQTFNLILCDIFEQESHPPCLVSQSFYQDVKSVLHPGGVFTLNATPESDAEMLAILQALRNSFSVVYIATIDNRGNVIVVANNNEAYSNGDIQRRAEVVSSRADIPLVEWVDRFRLIPVHASRPNL